MKPKHKLTVWEELGCGAVAGGVSRFIIAPLDVIKIRFQVQHTQHSGLYHYTGVLDAFKTVAKEEGIRAFWKGNLAAELMVVPWAAISFLTHQRFKALFQDSRTPTSSPLTSLLSGSIAATTATIATYPLDLLRTRMAVQTNQQKVYQSLSHACKEIFKREGFMGFYHGMMPTLAGVVPYMAIQFSIYERLKQRLPTDRTHTQEGAAGFVAGILSKFLTMPFDVVKKRIQVAGFQFYDASIRVKSMLSITTNIIQHEGLKGLFKGSWPALIKAGPNSAITFAVWEMSVRFVDRNSE